MQLRYVRPFSQYKPGDVVEVPDGAEFDEFYLERAEPEPPAAEIPATVPAPAAGPKEM